MVVLHQAVAIGATVIKLRRVWAENDLAGVRFSHANAAYETGIPLDVSGDVWTVPIMPAIRAAIPADAPLEFDSPTCLCRLVSDRGLDLPQDGRGVQEITVEFAEAVDIWNDLAVTP